MGVGGNLLAARQWLVQDLLPPHAGLRVLLPTSVAAGKRAGLHDRGKAGLCRGSALLSVSCYPFLQPDRRLCLVGLLILLYTFASPAGGVPHEHHCQGAPVCVGSGPRCMRDSG